jgi:hypothetical protein
MIKYPSRDIVPLSAFTKCAEKQFICKLAKNENVCLSLFLYFGAKFKNLDPYPRKHGMVEKNNLMLLSL